MVRYSERGLLLTEMEKVLRLLIFEGKLASKEFRDLMELYYGICTTRYLNPRSVVIKNDGLRKIFFDLNDAQFKNLVRMDKISFLHILDILNENQVFKNASRNSQVDVWAQLMVAFHRFGCEGNAASIESCAILIKEKSRTLL